MMPEPSIVIRPEKADDKDIVTNIIRQAFAKEKHSDQTEHLLVNRLRKSGAFIPELSLVAELNGKLIGHILLNRIFIYNPTNTFESLALAPVSVLPEYQGKGIGGRLIETAHQKAQEAGYSSIVLIGHKDYYPKFGYKPAHLFSITFPFEAPPENCMAVELQPGALTGVSGEVVYPEAFDVT